MTDSKGSVVVGQERSLDGLAGAVVVPDRGGQGQDALYDADPDPGGGVTAVLFEVELAFEGVVDGLDDLAQRLEELISCSWGLALAGRAQQLEAGVGEGGLEVAAEVVLVGDHDLPGPSGGQVGVGGEDAEQGLALVGLRAGQGEADRQPVQGAQQVQPQSPEEARMAGAVAVLGPPGQIGAPRGVSRSPAFD